MIYISSSCIQREKISQILKMYVENNIVNIELSGGTKYYSEIEKDLLSYKQQYGVNYVCHAYFPPPPEDFVVNLASCNDEIYSKSIEHYVSCLKLLQRLDCHVLSIHAGFLIEVLPSEIGKTLSDAVVYDREEALRRFCEAYKKIETVARQYNVTVYLENNVLSNANYERFKHKNYLLMTDYEGFQELREQMEFNLLLDVGHLYVSSCTLHKDFKEQCALFSNHVRWLHASENNGVVDEHRELEDDSEIVCAIRELAREDINITLETNTDITGIIRSKQIVEKMW